MKSENINKYNSFRRLCLTNAQDALRSAELLFNQNVNHIVYHLSVLALEEIGKIFIALQNFSSKENNNVEKTKIPLDDHVKKLFWAIWWPSFMNEKITKELIEETRNIASKLHSRRLELLYTDLLDISSLASKATELEASTCLSFVKARLQLATIEHDIDEDNRPNEDMSWFIEVSNIENNRKFIFGNEAQEKLIEFGEISKWLKWLKKHFENEEEGLKELLLNEINRNIPLRSTEVNPKWRIKFTLVSPSHSIRQNIFALINKEYGFIKLSRGANNHTLGIEITLGNNISIADLWFQGLQVSKIFVAALNVATKGIFFWNITTDTEKYYDRIVDLESHKEVSAKLLDSFKVNWEAARLTLNETELHLTFLVFEYFSKIIDEKEFEPIYYYQSGLAMFAKTDIHLRLELEAFKFFYKCFIISVQNNQKINKEDDIKEIAYEQIKGLLTTRFEYDMIMDLGSGINNNPSKVSQVITLKEVIGIKQYCSFYILTLAVRKLRKDNSLKLTNQNNIN